jgi:hypothetical protein
MEDLVVLKPTAGREIEPDAARPETPGDMGMPIETFEVFWNAGWVFVEPTETIRRVEEWTRRTLPGRPAR